MKRSFPEIIESERLILRTSSASDADTIFSAIQKDRIRLRKYLPWVDRTITADNTRLYIQECFDNRLTGTAFDYAMYLKKDGAFVGMCGINAVDWEDRRAELGYWLVGEHESQGYATEAVCALESECYSAGINRIEIRCSPENVRSASVPIRAGYLLEGLLRENVVHVAGFRNTLLFAKLRTDPPPTSETRRIATPPEFLADTYWARMARVEDIPGILEFYRKNQARFAWMAPQPPSDFLTAGYWERQIHEANQQFFEGTALRLFLFDPTPRAAVMGTIQLLQIKPSPYFSAEATFSLSGEYEGKGIMFQALGRTLGLAFEELGLHRVRAFYLPDNHRAAALLKRIGFEGEGVSRSHLLVRGAWKDYLIVSKMNPKPATPKK